MKDLVPLALDPDRLTFVAGPASFDEDLDLEADFAGLIGIGLEDPFDTPEHHAQACDAEAQKRNTRPRLYLVK